jgi:hypothetical protein
MPTGRRVLSVILAAVLLSGCMLAGAQKATEPTHAFRSVVPVLSTVPAPCPTASAAGGVEVELFDAPGGGCVRQDQLREYRCSSEDDPVIEAAGLRFLGGRFSLPVPQMPSAAILLGRHGDEEVFAVPGDRPTLLVRTTEGVRRWLTVVSPPDPAHPSALFLGDSIMVGSRGAVGRALPGWDTEFHAKIGRTTEEGIAVARTLRGIENRDAVVVELGTNESIEEGFPALVHRMLSIVGGARLVVWVTVHRLDLEFIPDINSDIVRAMSEVPNGAVADWSSAVTPEDLVDDGVHPSDQGKRLMADLVGGLLTRWRDAATGHGAAACAPPA